jgi:hypothetical protein
MCSESAVQSYDCITLACRDTPDMLPGKLQGYVKDVDKGKLRRPNSQRYISLMPHFLFTRPMLKTRKYCCCFLWEVMAH